MKKRLLIRLSIICTTSLFSIALNAQPGALDNTFGTNGIVTTDFFGDNDMAQATVVQPDGKIVVAGSVYLNGFAIARYNSDGSLDNSFGVGGKVTTTIGLGSGHGFSLALQNDGKILLAGTCANAADLDFALIRYTSSGNLDNTFGIGGKVITPIGNNSESAYSIAIQPDGKIILAGRSSNANLYDFRFALVRYNSDGSLDNTFGTGGKVTTAIGAFSEGYSVTLQADGKILVAGNGINGSYYEFTIVRYNADGSLDASFGTGGIVTTPIGGDHNYGQSVKVQSDGKIVVTGFFQIVNDSNLGIIRYNSDGTLDNTFGTGGIVTNAFGSIFVVGLSSVLQQDGKIIIGGYISGISDLNIIVARFNTDGNLDLSFGNLGSVSIPTASNYLTPFGGQGAGWGLSIALQSDEKIVVAGNSPVSMYDFITLRLHNDATNEIAENNVTDVNLFPNPFNDYVVIECTIEQLNSTYSIINNAGQQVQTGTLTDAKTIIDIKPLVSGVYVINIDTKGGPISKQIIKN